MGSIDPVDSSKGFDFGSIDKMFNKEPPKMSKYLSSAPTGNGVYLDMGTYFNDQIAHSSPPILDMSTNPPQFKQPQLDDALNALFKSVPPGSKLILSFDQVAEMKNLATHTSTKWPDPDTISQTFGNVDGGPPAVVQGAPNEFFLNRFTDLAKGSPYNMKVDVAFGGESSIATEKGNPWAIGNSNQAQQGTTDGNLLKEFGFTGVDFDVEHGASLNDFVAEPGMSTYIQNLRSDLKSGDNQNPECTLTVEGQDASSTGQLKDFLGANFDKMFTGLNIMAYSGSNYYLSATSLKSWISSIPADDLSKVHIGFNDQVDYSKATNADPNGKVVPPSNLQGGAAAADVYQQVCKNAGIDPSKLGSPFLWEGAKAQDPATSTFMKDFEDYMKSYGGAAT